MEAKAREWTKAQWVAVYTNPRAEKRVAEELTIHGFENYLPLKRELRQWSDRKKWVETPLFTSYVFVRITCTQEVPLRQVPGVSHIVTFGFRSREVAFIPESQIEAVRALCQGYENVIVRNAKEMKRGSRVKILAGPLEGKEGILIDDCVDGNFGVEIEALCAVVMVRIEKDLLQFISNEDSKKKGGIFSKKNL